MNKSKKPSFWAKFRFKRSSRSDRTDGDDSSSDRFKSNSPRDRDEIVINRTLERHRRRIIRRAQQYRSFFINTNQHIVSISLVVLIVAGLVFSGFIYLRLYRNQDYSVFIYNVTQILPLPVARVGSSFVSYEDYLRNLRRQIHYFETQQQVDFSQPDPDAQITLVELKNAAMQRVIDQVYIEKLAQRYDLSVTSEEIDERLELLQAQNKLGRDLDDIEDVLDNFWGLTLEEYRQIVANKILQQKVIRQMDETLENNAYARMQTILRRLNGSEDFAELAIIHSEDVITSVNGGEYNFLLDLEEREEDPLVLKAIFETPVGQFSDIIDTGERLEIIKVLSDEGEGLRRAAHIRISYLLLSDVLKDIREEEPVEIYVDDVIYNF